MHEPATNDIRANERARVLAIKDPPEVDPDDIPRVVPNRADKRRLLKKLRRLPAGRTGRPSAMRRKTGSPDYFVQWAREGLIRELRRRGVRVSHTVPGHEVAGGVHVQESIPEGSA